MRTIEPVSTAPGNPVQQELAALRCVDESTVGRSARTGAAWSAVQIVARNVLSLAVTATLARLLTPDDYGLMSMVATLTSLLLVFSDLGLTWATVQRRELTHIQVSNLFWVNLTAGALLWVVCLIGAEPVARFYGRDELRLVTMALGATFVVGGATVQPFALLQRQMRFKLIAQIEIAAAALPALGAIAAALMGAGYWALVLQGMLMQIVRACLAFPHSGLRLEWPRRDAATGDAVGFGGLLALNGLLIYLARNLDCVLIGRRWGGEQLGYYNRAYFLMLLPNMLATGVLTNVMIPSLSALQGDTRRLGHAYRRAVRLVAFVGAPIAGGLALVANEAVHVMYGAQWAGVAPMLLWLSVACMTQPVYNTYGWLFTATGNAKGYLTITAFNGIVLAIVFYWAVQRSPVHVAQAYGITMGIGLLWPALWLAHIAAGIRLRETVWALLPVYGAVSLMMLWVAALGWVCGRLNVGWEVTLGVRVIGGIVIYWLGARVLLKEMIREDVAPMLPARLKSLISER